MNLLYLTVADAGITLDLDKDWHSDLYEHHDACIETFFLFLHMYELTRERTFGLQFATLRLYPSVQVRKKHLSKG